ncbi:hypothetical protein BDR06DRAFT_979690 [Suillus hirtellus]|nr:hypothetical protein BDR06DRAFT_979690 [Suillus hirtellus]
MYLAGIIPGPSEPSGDELNFFLDPVVDDMVKSWEHRIRYSCTALNAYGQVTRSAIACLVCDLSAARKATQLVGPMSHFYYEVRHYAELWKNARTSAEHNKLFASHRVRWSTLWRLSYWDPSRQIVVDTMHCLLEGLMHTHFHEFLGLTSDSAHHKPAVIPAFTYPFLDIDLNKPQEFQEKDVRVVKSIQSLITEAVPNLEGNDLQLIEDHLAQYFTLLVLLYPLKSSLCSIRPNLSLLSYQNCTSLPQKSYMPSSLRSVPYNFGETKAGTLKADEWHTLTTLYLPIALVSLWGEGSTHCTSEITVNHCVILDHMMALVSAVHIVLLPHAPHRTNGHMALHVWDYLQLFGPVRSWWCFPYEHLIGQLQQLPNNHIFDTVLTFVNNRLLTLAYTADLHQLIQAWRAVLHAHTPGIIKYIFEME